MWNAISLIQNLNSCRRVHFLHHGHLHFGYYATGTSPDMTDIYEMLIKILNSFPNRNINIIMNHSYSSVELLDSQVIKSAGEDESVYFR